MDFCAFLTGSASGYDDGWNDGFSAGAEFMSNRLLGKAVDREEIDLSSFSEDYAQGYSKGYVYGF